jgi:hypothetical protein
MCTCCCSPGCRAAPDAGVVVVVLLVEEATIGIGTRRRAIQLSEVPLVVAGSFCKI